MSKSSKMTRREVLKLAGAAGTGVVIGATGLGGLLPLSKANPASAPRGYSDIPFFGNHQAGIVTEVQNHIYLASFHVTATSKEELIRLFKDWTKAADLLTQGKILSDTSNNLYLPPTDTGEAAGLSASNLTITFGVGPSLFEKDGQDRFGLKSQQPEELVDLPKFPLDALEKEWTGGDLCIQACADDPQVAFHAVRNLARIARGKAVLHWAQEGFQRTKLADLNKETPRNLFGFKDGTVNPNVHDEKEMNQHLWVQSSDGQKWLENGTYMVVRRIQMYLEVWDRTTLGDQEATFGRHRESGAPLGQKGEFDPINLKNLPDTSHVRIAHGDGKMKILRRSYSYTAGMNPKNGTIDAGLLFISFQRSPSKQFIPIQQMMAAKDKLNEYVVHRGSALFACLPGIKEGRYIGETLFQ